MVDIENQMPSPWAVDLARKSDYFLCFGLPSIPEATSVAFEEMLPGVQVVPSLIGGSPWQWIHISWLSASKKILELGYIKRYIKKIDVYKGRERVTELPQGNNSEIKLSVGQQKIQISFLDSTSPSKYSSIFLLPFVTKLWKIPTLFILHIPFTFQPNLLWLLLQLTLLKFLLVARSY